MLRLPKLQWLAPKTFAAAARMLAQAGPEALALAGGTDVLPKLKRRQARQRLLVDLSGIEGFRGVRRRAKRVAIGAGTRIADLLRSPKLLGFHALREAAACVATPQIRNAATVGGNLALHTRCHYYDQSGSWRAAQGFCLKTDDGAPCRAAPGSGRCLALAAADLPPALLALDARVRLIGPDGEREVLLAEIYQDDGCRPLRLQPGELIAEVLLDPRPRRSTYRKLRRRGSFDFASLGVAVALGMRGEEVADCRIVLAGLASAPISADEAGSLLAGGRPTPERIAAAAAAAARQARPVENSEFTAAYRRRMTGVFVSRALRELTGLP